MVGVIHQLFFAFVEKNFGAKAVAEVKRQAGRGGRPGVPHGRRLRRRRVAEARSARR